MSDNEDWLRRWLPPDPEWRQEVWRPRWQSICSMIVIYAGVAGMVWAIARTLAAVTR